MDISTIERWQKKCVEKLIANIEQTQAFIASPSNKNPDYIYHWVRDAALMIRIITDEYKKTNNPEYFKILIKYICCEHDLQMQSQYCQSDLGEPKFHVNRKPFDDEWGRPQNDGPALRGLALLEILPLLTKEYECIAKNIVIPMIKKDMDYVIEHKNNASFDLWEEKKGYHFYTRVVQCKFVKNCFIYFYKNYSYYFHDDDLTCLKVSYDRLKELINHHYSDLDIISSFDKDGKEMGKYDASVVLALCHIDFDAGIVEKDKYYLVDNTIFNLICHFNDKYHKNYNYIGRYMNDRYFDGHAWILCTLGMVQYLKHRQYAYNNFVDDPENPHTEDKRDILNNFLSHEKILENILNIDENLDLSEQYDPAKKRQISAKNLSWNYSELYYALK